MNNSKAFGIVLSRIRKEQGFPSAHQFFRGVGGSKSLGFAFVSYWDMERGKKLPKSWRLKAIMAALSIDQHSSKAKELVRAYFKALSGSDELIEIIAAPDAVRTNLPGRELAEAAVHAALDLRRVNLTMEQWKLCARDMKTFICQYFLVNTSGWVTVRELAEATRLKPAAVKTALKTLASGGLVVLSGDKVQSPFAKRMVELLPATPATADIKAALRGHLNKWVEGSRRIDSKRITVRMSKANIATYRQHLEKAVELASIYSNTEENRQDSAIYLVDTNIFQILPRD